MVANGTRSIKNYDELLQRYEPQKLPAQRRQGGKGRAAMSDSSVILAKDKTKNDYVAIKPMDTSSDGWQAEIQSRKKVGSSPYIAALREAVEVDSTKKGYLVMDYIPEDFNAFVDRKPLEQELRAAAHGVLEGISALHAAGLAHRDIRAPNILVGVNHAVVIDLEKSEPLDDAWRAADIRDALWLIQKPLEKCDPSTLSPAALDFLADVNKATTDLRVGTGSAAHVLQRLQQHRWFDEVRNALGGGVSA